MKKIKSRKGKNKNRHEVNSQNTCDISRDSRITSKTKRK